ncbi:hypothetical protein BaRGS_00017980, partial [Batillaria attramentaria]
MIRSCRAVHVKFATDVCWRSQLAAGQFASGGHPFLLFANRRDVRIIDAEDPKSNSTVVISNLKDAAAVDFIFSDDWIFWTDVSLEVIERTYLNSSQTSVNVISTGIVSPDGLACDWLGKKLYWTDSETNRIEVSNLDGSHRKVLFWQRLDQPRAIALDPQNGYVYWTDWGEVPKIERAGMDGDQDSREVIVNDNIFWPNGLTIDYKDSKIYWADAKLHYIHSCDFDGSNRRVIVEGGLPHPFALTVFEDNLYWTDWQTRSIHTCNKHTAAETMVVHEDIYSPMDIHVFSAKRQPSGVNPCGDSNGGCSHLCLMSPRRPFYTCACPTGVKLLSDNKTCAEGAEKILFLARRRDLRKISLDTPDYTAVVMPLDNIQHAIAIDYDPVDKYVYWTDDEARAIQRARLDGTGQEVLVNTEVDHPDGIAIDWVGRNLYWTDTGMDRIEVTRLNGSARKVLITDNLDEPRAICLDPQSGYMYWSDWGKRPKIERANLDGTDRVVLVNTDLGWPNGLAVDIKEGRLYWGDAKTDRIEMSDLMGKNRRPLVSENLPHIFGFTLLGDYIYWTDWQRRSIERVNKTTGLQRVKVIDQLPDLMGLKAVDVHRQEGTNPCADNNNGCSHLCLYRPPPKGPICACPMGLELVSNGTTCIVPEAFLLFSSQSNINRISLETSHYNQPIPIQGVKEAVAIDFDFKDNRIYVTDVRSKRISRAFMNGSSLEHIIEFGLNSAEGMAVDWVAHNIYWADMKKNRIEMARLDGSSRKVLIWRNLDNPRALALDPPSGLGRVQDLTIDYIDRRLYWADIDQRRIQSSNLLGQDRQLVVSSQLPRPMGLTQYEDYVYWTDLASKSIERANKITGLDRTLIQDGVDLPMDISVIHASRQSGSNACGQQNGGCSHLCLAHSADHKDNQTHHCACPTHYRLNADGKTCSAPKEYLLLSQKTEISRMVMDSDTSDESDDGDEVDNPEVTLPIHGRKNIKSLAYDPVEQYIYWVEGRQKIIKRAHDNGTSVEVMLNNPSGKFQPYDIAIDPYSRTLYWTCSVNNVVNVTRLDMTPVGVVLQAPNNFKPRSIALFPERGYMFFTNMVKSPRIESARMDGSEKTELFIKGLVHPLSLTIDKTEGKLYWADADFHRIEMSDLTGGNRRVLVDGQISNPRGLAVHGNFLYWLDRDQQLIERCQKKTGSKRLYVRGRMQGLSDLIAVQHSLDISSHPCASNNGGCSHICLVDSGSKARCSCPYNLVLKKDGLTCADPPTCPPDHFTCKSGGITCIPLVWRCDNLSECEDDSDEQDCPACGNSQFHCVSGECISESQRCNGTPQCKDSSDEKGCCGKVACSGCGGPNQGPCPEGSTDECGGGGCGPLPTNDKSQQNATHYAIAIVVGVVFLILVILVILVCRRRTRHAPLADDDILMAKKPLNPQTNAEPPATPPHTLTSRGGKTSASGGLSLGGSSTSGLPPFYDRNHVTGASSSSSTGTQYPQETLNPPPSPVTERSAYTGG